MRTKQWYVAHILCPERGPEGDPELGPEEGPEGGPEGGVQVLSTPHDFYTT